MAKRVVARKAARVVGGASAKKTRTWADEPSYEPFLKGVAGTFATFATDAGALFTVETEGLWDLYLRAFPKSERQHYTCSACRHFVQRFGGLVTIADDGSRVSACWNAEAVPAEFAKIAATLQYAVARRPVVAAFVAKAGVLGQPVTGEWSHIAIRLPEELAHRDRLREPGQVAAAIRENVQTVERALEEFSVEALGEALRILEADALSRSEKFVGPVRWMLDLQTRRAESKDERKRAAILWRAVATSPEGYSHPRASVVGPLLEGIIAGKSFETLRSEFAAMLHPLRYQRPTAAPSSGNIAAAERVVEQLGIERSLERRFARLDECETLWAPTPKRHAAREGGVFAHLAPKEAPAVGVNLPTQTMTWEKFTRTVLPTAEVIEFYIPSHGNFEALVTATHADAPPIVRWDREDRRNPVTHYVYHGGSHASRWQLLAQTWRTVTAIVPSPNMWGDRPQPQHGENITLVLDGAVDTQINELALFPETLRDDLREIRSTIEAFSKKGIVTGAAHASACGYGIGKRSADVRLRVTVAGRATEYHIDRWD